MESESGVFKTCTQALYYLPKLEMKLYLEEVRGGEGLGPCPAVLRACSCFLAIIPVGWVDISDAGD